MVLRAASIGVLPARTTRTPATRVEGPGAGEAEAVGGVFTLNAKGRPGLAAWPHCTATMRGGEGKLSPLFQGAAAMTQHMPSVCGAARVYKP